jgi:hypothetical protein
MPLVKKPSADHKSIEGWPALVPGLRSARAEAPPAVAQKSLAGAAIELLAEMGTAAILPELQNCAAGLSAGFLAFSIKMASNQIVARSARPGG